MSIFRNLTQQAEMSGYLYEEEYNTATPLITSILWGKPGEQNQAAKQLESLNTQIRAKNRQANIPGPTGLIEISVFQTAAERLEGASLAFLESRDTEPFNDAEAELHKSISENNWPLAWKIEWDQFLDYHYFFTGDDPSNDHQNKGSVHEESSDERADYLSYQDDASYGDDASYRDEGSYRDDGYYQDDVEDDGSYQIYGSYQDDGSCRDDVSYQDDISYRDDISYQDDGRDYENANTLDDESVYIGEPHPKGLSEDVVSDSTLTREALKPRSSKTGNPDCNVSEGTDHSKWKGSTSLTTIRRNAQERYGILLSSGSVLGWRESEENGRLLILGYECRGKRIARVKLAEKNELESIDTEQDPLPRGGTGDWTAKQVSGVGLVAWEVKDTAVSYAAAGLYPTKKGVYPKTFIWVHWVDGNSTWESRESFRSIMDDLDPYKVDIIIYFVATSQESEYQEMLTGDKPVFPTPRMKDTEEDLHCARSPTPEPETSVIN